MLLRGGRSSCEGQGEWVDSDVGWMDVGRVNGLSIDKLCQGKVWEPHVAKAIGRYLHGQGAALDVGCALGASVGGLVGDRTPVHTPPHTSGQSQSQYTVPVPD